MPKIIVGLLLVFQLLFLPSLVLAQTPNCSDPNTPTSLACLPVFLGNISSSALILAGVAAVFFITFSGIQFLTSGGEAQKVESAKKTFTFAVIGLLIILFSYTIIKVVSRTTNVNPETIGIKDKK